MNVQARIHHLRSRTHFEMDGGTEAEAAYFLVVSALMNAVKGMEDAGRIAKGRRMTRRESGIPRQPRSSIPGSKGTRWKRKITGEVVPR